MCEDLEKQYNALLHEYQKCVEKKMAPEDYLQYNEILFSAHSLGIEGNSYTINDTKALKELGLGMVPTNKPLVETMEMLDHFHAYEQMLDSITISWRYMPHSHTTPSHTVTLAPTPANTLLWTWEQETHSSVTMNN